MNYFELFGLPAGLEIDLARLSTSYHSLQQQYHPDRFAAAPQSERLAAMQQAAEINSGYQTLKDPLSRAEYLLYVLGLDIRDEQQTMQDLAFLTRQLEWREELETIRDAADPEATIDAFSREIRAEEQQFYAELDKAIASQMLAEAAGLIRKLKFVRKLRDELARLEDSLMDI